MSDWEAEDEPGFQRTAVDDYSSPPDAVNDMVEEFRNLPVPNRNSAGSVHDFGKMDGPSTSAAAFGYGGKAKAHFNNDAEDDDWNPKSKNDDDGGFGNGFDGNKTEENNHRNGFNKGGGGGGDHRNGFRNSNGFDKEDRRGGGRNGFGGGGGFDRRNDHDGFGGGDAGGRGFDRRNDRDGFGGNNDRRNNRNDRDGGEGRNGFGGGGGGRRDDRNGFGGGGDGGSRGFGNQRNGFRDGGNDRNDFGGDGGGFGSGNRRNGFNNRDEGRNEGGFGNRRNGGEGGDRDGFGGGGFGNRRDGGDRDGFGGGGFGNRRDGGDRDGFGGGGFGNRRSGGDGGDRDGGGFGNRGRRGDTDDNNNDDNKKREFYIPPELPSDEKSMFSNGIATGINFSKYDSIPIKVSGQNAPKQIEQFDELSLREIVSDNIRKSSYTKPTPIQKIAIPVILKGMDLMACAQTGSGKTAAYLIPIINNLLNQNPDMKIGKPFALVLSPTRELAIQIYTEAKKFAFSSYLRISLIYGGTSSKHQSEDITKGCHILIATPGRLLDFVDKEYISFENIAYVVLDEADRMLDMGFKESIHKVMRHDTMPVDKPPLCAMFSATFPEEIQHLAAEYLKNYIFVSIGIVGGACSDVKQTFFEVPKGKKRAKLIEILQDDLDGTIVFVETKRGADFLASFLSDKDLPTTSIHGDRLQSQRETALRDFRTGRMKVLIATNVAARGLDIKNVRHVVNYDLPESIDEYVHRIGRTGRLGNDGRSTSFFDRERDEKLAGDLVRILEDAKQEVPSFLAAYSNGGGGGYPSSGGNRFGGRDVRGKNFGKQEEGGDVGPALLEEVESWD